MRAKGKDWSFILCGCTEKRNCITERSWSNCGPIIPHDSALVHPARYCQNPQAGPRHFLFPHPSSGNSNSLMSIVSVAWYPRGWGWGYSLFTISLTRSWRGSMAVKSVTDLLLETSGSVSSTHSLVAQSPLTLAPRLAWAHAHWEADLLLIWARVEDRYQDSFLHFPLHLIVFEIGSLTEPLRESSSSLHVVSLRNLLLLVPLYSPLSLVSLGQTDRQIMELLLCFMYMGALFACASTRMAQEDAIQKLSSKFR